MKNKNTRRQFLGKIAAGPLAFSAALTGSARANIQAGATDPAHSWLSKTNLPGTGKKFVPVMLTPYTDDGRIDFNHLSSLTDFYRAAGAKGLFANCLSSEMYSLSPDERVSLATHVVKRVNGAVPVVACGSFGNDIKERAEFTKRMYDTGVQAVILITGHFAEQAESDETMIRNLDEFFRLTGNIPLGTYECPSPYKRLLTPKVLEHVLQYDRLIYHKDTSLDVAQIKQKLDLARGSRLELFDAHAPNTMYSLQAGAKGMSAIAGNFYPEIFAWMCENATNPLKAKDVETMQGEITRMDPVVSTSYSKSAKYFLRKRGLPIREFCRTNSAPLTEKEKQVLDGVHQIFLDWCNGLGISPAKAS